MLRHKSATMTLDLYGHLFDDRLDDVAGAQDVARTARGLPADSLRTNGQLIKLPRLRALQASKIKAYSSCPRQDSNLRRPA
jgi:hypothetical protein